MVQVLWYTSLASAAMAGAVAAVWVVSYWAEEEFSLNRVVGPSERPQETTLAVYSGLGSLSVYRRLRVFTDERLVDYLRQFLGRGWFFRHSRSGRPIQLTPGSPLLRFRAGRSRSDADVASWRSIALVLPCWFVLVACACASFAGWKVGSVTARAVVTAAAVTFLLSLIPLSILARRGLRAMNEQLRRMRQEEIDKALAEGRLERGMTMGQVQQVLAGWSGRRTHYSIGRRRSFEMWEFRRDAPPAAIAPPDEAIGVFFLNGEVGVSFRHDLA